MQAEMLQRTTKVPSVNRILHMRPEEFARFVAEKGPDQMEEILQVTANRKKKRAEQWLAHSSSGLRGRLRQLFGFQFDDTPLGKVYIQFEHDVAPFLRERAEGKRAWQAATQAAASSTEDMWRVMDQSNHRDYLRLRDQIARGGVGQDPTQ